MGISNQATTQRFPFKMDDVFNAFTLAAQECGLSIQSEDAVLGRITAKAGASALSWGENVVVKVEKVDDLSSNVVIESALKFGANIAGAHRHNKNFEALISKASEILRNPLYVEEKAARAQVEAANQEEEKSSVISLVFLVLFVGAVILYLKFGL